MNVCAVAEVVNAPARRMIAANAPIISFLSCCLITIYLLLILDPFPLCSLQCKFQSKVSVNEPGFSIHQHPGGAHCIALTASRFAKRNELGCSIVQSIGDQSLRSAIIGSTPVARRAGSQQASSAAPASVKEARIKVSASVALTPYRSCVMTLVSASAPAIPSVIPTSVNNASLDFLSIRVEDASDRLAQSLPFTGLGRQSLATC